MPADNCRTGSAFVSRNPCLLFNMQLRLSMPVSCEFVLLREKFCSEKYRRKCCLPGRLTVSLSVPSLLRVLAGGASLSFLDSRISLQSDPRALDPILKVIKNS